MVERKSNVSSVTEHGVEKDSSYIKAAAIRGALSSSRTKRSILSEAQNEARLDELDVEKRNPAGKAPVA